MTMMMLSNMGHRVLWWTITQIFQWSLLPHLRGICVLKVHGVVRQQAATFQRVYWLNWIIYSGLDSSSSLQVISHLKSLVQGGRTIVCSIHQPSSRLFEMFDDLYVLAEGQCLYSGPIQDMTAVFERAGFSCPKYYNRADFGE